MPRLRDAPPHWPPPTSFLVIRVLFCVYVLRTVIVISAAAAAETRVALEHSACSHLMGRMVTTDNHSLCFLLHEPCFFRIKSLREHTQLSSKHRLLFATYDPPSLIASIVSSISHAFLCSRRFYWCICRPRVPHRCQLDGHSSPLRYHHLSREDHRRGEAFSGEQTHQGTDGKYCCLDSLGVHARHQ